MCTELILALIYFFTILVVNYFLYKVLLDFRRKILYLLKIRNILSNFKTSKSSIFSFLYNYSKVDSKFPFKIFNKVSTTTDSFIIGNTYKYLVELLKNEDNLNTATLYYFQLLENQYLSKAIRLK